MFRSPMDFTLILCSGLLAGAAVFTSYSLLLRVVDRLGNRQVGRIGNRYLQLGMNAQWLTWAMRTWLLTFVLSISVLIFLFRMAPVAVFVGVILYFAPQQILDLLIARRCRIFRNQLSTVARSLANALSAGMPPVQALAEISEEAADPVGSELRRVVADYRNGRPLDEALAERRVALDLDPFTVFALSIETTLKRGGNLGNCLARLSTSLQEEQRLQAKIETSTASGRQTILLLSGFPVVFLVLYYFMMREGVELLFTNFFGQIILGVIMLLVFGGYSIANRMLKFDI
jgi:tight adherence protein B